MQNDAQMPELDAAIERLKAATPEKAPWTALDFSDKGEVPIDKDIAAILNAVVSGKLTRSDLCASGQQVRERIEVLIEDAMIDATVDFPAGREAGPSITWDSDKLLDDILAALTPAPQPEGQVQRLSDAIRQACDLLAERKYGSPARSPAHNARLALEAALTTAPAAAFPQPGRKDSGEPCGECRLPAGETCDICGAVAPGAAQTKRLEDRTVRSIAEGSTTLLDTEIMQMMAQEIADHRRAAQTEAVGREWWIVLDHGFYRACPRKPAHGNPVLAREVVATHPAAPAPGIAEADIEIMARAMCESDMADFDAPSSQHTANGQDPEDQREYWRDKARIALRALANGGSDAS